MSRSPFAVTIHGYGGYTAGCKCEVCRAAKASRMREVRAAARKQAQRFTESPLPKSSGLIGLARYTAIGVKHGTRFAYDEKGCRCIPCSERAADWKSSPNGHGRVAA